MKLLTTLLTMALAAFAFACQNLGGEDREFEISVRSVPDAVVAAAQKAVPGFVIEEACKEVEDGTLVYCLEGEANGKEYEIDVTADGRVLDVESGDDEDNDEYGEEEGEEEDDD